MDVLRLSKGTVLGTACPTCHAPASQYCQRSKKGSTANHQDRVRAARKAAIISLAPAQRVESEEEIEHLRSKAVSRLRSMAVSDDDKAECIKFLGMSKGTKKPTRQAASRLNETIRYGGNWHPIDNDPFEIRDGRVVALPKAGELF